MPRSALHLENYGKHHFVGSDCRITCLRNIFDYLGIKVSYATLFGLSSSFHFGYRDGFGPLEFLQYPDRNCLEHFLPISGTRLDCAENLAFNYSATIQGNFPDDAETSLARLRNFTKQGLPVMVAVSRQAIGRYLGWKDDTPGFLGDIYFGEHWLVLTSVNDAANSVTVFEPDIPRPVEMPLAVFQQARGHGDEDSKCFLKSRNRWIVLLPPRPAPPKQDLIRTALTKTLFLMTSPSGQEFVHYGLDGLRTFSNALLSWEPVCDRYEDRLKATAWMLYVQGEIVASGGLGRKVYASYLRQSAAVCRSASLREAADCCAEAAHHWTSLIGRIKTCLLSDRVSSLKDDPEIATLLRLILSREEDTMGHISTYLTRGDQAAR